MAKSPAAILYDESGNAVGVVLDGSVYRLRLETKIARASDGAYVNPATQETLAAIKDTDGIKKVAEPTPNAPAVTGTISALDGYVSTTFEGWASCGITLTGTWVATLMLEVSGDGGTTWAFVGFVTSPPVPAPIPVLSVALTENGSYDSVGIGAATHIRLRAVEYTSGTVNVRITRSMSPESVACTFSFMQQNVQGSVANSSTANLAAGGSFTGAAESTLGVAALQVNLASDQPCLISIQQSPDGTNWDVVDEWLVLAGVGDSRTFQATASFFRLVCQNIGNATTTYLRLQTALCPTVEAVPRALTPGGKLRLATMTTSFAPDPANFSDRMSGRALLMDSSRNLICRASSHTDEGSFRDDFSSASIYEDLTGTCYFTNGSVYVTGSGTSFLSEVLVGGRTLKLSSHADSSASHVADVLSDELLELAEPYAGATGSGTGRMAHWHYTSGTGTTITQASSELVLASGTTSGSVVQALHHGDYLPIMGAFTFWVSQRITNQEIVVGLLDDPDAPTAQACFVLSGTTATEVQCRSSSDTGDTETTTATLPDGLTTATKARYTIEVIAGSVVFSCNEVVLVRHKLHIPGNYEVLNSVLRIRNTGTPASSTTLNVDVTSLSNFNIVEVGRQALNEPLPIRSVEEVHSICGKITTTATTADQVVLSYTVPAGKTFWIAGYTINNGETTIRANPYKIGKNTVTSEPAGPGVVDGNIFRMGNMPQSSFRDEDFSGNPRRMAVAGDVVKMTVTPSGVTSTVWRASLDFILR